MKADQTSEMSFQRVGGAFQLVVNSFEQFPQILALDDAHWALTSIDIEALRVDPAFLKFLDTDGNRKIRTSEVRSALQYMLANLRDGSGVNAASSVLSLDAVNADAPEGARIIGAARVILANLGTPDAREISLEQVRSDNDIKSCAQHNGDGVITPDAENAPELAKRIEAIIRVSGATKDLSGAEGVTLEAIDNFAARIRAYVEWLEAPDAPGAQLTPFAEQTEQVHGLFRELAPVIDGFFMTSAALSFLDGDPERLAKKELAADVRSASEVEEVLRKLVLAAPNQEKVLDLHQPVNPLYGAKLAAFAALPCLAEYFQGGRLSAAAWQTLKDKLASCCRWHDADPDRESGFFRAYSRAELHELASPAELEELRKLVREDLAAGNALAAAQDLHKLLLFQHLMLEFLQNFVSLSRLFDPEHPSLLQYGTLIMDGRHFSLAVPVSDLAEHKRIVDKSDICVAYIEITRGIPSEQIRRKLAVAVTSGSMRNLFTGKRGIFFDTAREQYDARIIDFVDQPVSVTEALKSPFYRFGAFVTSQADKFLNSKSAGAQKMLGDQIAGGKVLTAPPPVQQNAPGAGSMLLMGGSIGIAAIGSSLAFIAKQLEHVSFLRIVSFLCGVLVVFGGPVVVVSLVKLYRRNLGRFLEAAGCAVNRPMRLSHRLGRFFTFTPRLPRARIFREDLAKITGAARPRNGGMVVLIAVIDLLLGFGVAWYLLHSGCKWPW